MCRSQLCILQGGSFIQLSVNSENYNPSIHPCTHSPDGPSRPATTSSIFSFHSVLFTVRWTASGSAPTPVNDVVDPPSGRSSSSSVSVHHAQHHCFTSLSSSILHKLMCPNNWNFLLAILLLQYETKISRCPIDCSI